MRWVVYILLPLQLFAQETYTNCGDIIPQNYQVSYDVDKVYYWDISAGEIIYNQGGYYFDTTFEILKPLYNILNKRKYKFIGCNEVPRFKDYHILSNSFFGATKNNVIIKRLLTKKKLDNIDFYDILVDFQTGP